MKFLLFSLLLVAITISLIRTKSIEPQETDVPSEKENSDLSEIFGKESLINHYEQNERFPRDASEDAGSSIVSDYEKTVETASWISKNKYIIIGIVAIVLIMIICCSWDTICCCC